METSPASCPEPLPVPATQPVAAQLDYASVTQAPGKGGLVGISVIFFIVGGLGVLVTAAMVRMLAQISSTGVLIPSLLTYMAMTVACILVGVGCCRARRWTRPLVLAALWPWLVIGPVSMLQGIITLLRIQRSVVGGGAAMPPAMQTTMVVATMLFGGVFTIGLPALLVWFFQRRKTAETLSFYDPTPGWLDRCPLPVLTWALWTGCGGLMYLLSLSHRVVPVFGVLIGGVSGALIIVSIAAMLLILAIGSYLLKPWAWWLSLLVTAALSVSWLTLVLGGGMAAYMQRQMGVELQSQPALAALGDPAAHLTSVATMLLWLGFLLYLRRYFVTPVAQVAAGKTATFG